MPTVTLASPGLRLWGLVLMVRKILAGTSYCAWFISLEVRSSLANA